MPGARPGQDERPAARSACTRDATKALGTEIATGQQRQGEQQGRGQEQASRAEARDAAHE